MTQSYNVPIDRRAEKWRIRVFFAEKLQIKVKLKIVIFDFVI